MELILFLSCFLVLLIIGFPIALNLLTSSIVYLYAADYPLALVGQRLFEGMNGFALLAVPFFVLMGQLMLKGRLLEALADFVSAFFGHMKGALGFVVIGTCLLMGSIVGLAVAVAASLGSLMIPMMKEQGYSPGFSSAVMSSAALLGAIMPPGVLMVIYCIAVGRTSIAGLFLATIIPAFLIAIAQMFIVHRRALKENLPSQPKAAWPEKWRKMRAAIPALMLPVIILGGIFGRIFTVTEASAVGALYAFIYVFFITRKVTVKDLPGIFLETAVTSGLIILLVGAGTVAAWVVANEQIVNNLMAPISHLPAWGFLLLVNVILIIFGMFMDDAASAVVLGPIIAPIAWSLGIDPIHIGAIFCTNLVIGLATPPFGIVLFVTSPIAKVTIEETFKYAWPMIAASIGVLLIMTFFPQTVLWLPRLFGY